MTNRQTYRLTYTKTNINSHVTNWKLSVDRNRSWYSVLPTSSIFGKYHQEREIDWERERQRQTDRQTDSFIKEKAILPIESCLLEWIDPDILFSPQVWFLESITKKERLRNRQTYRQTSENKLPFYRLKSVCLKEKILIFCSSDKFDFREISPRKREIERKTDR